MIIDSRIYLLSSNNIFSSSTGILVVEKCSFYRAPGWGAVWYGRPIYGMVNVDLYSAIIMIYMFVFVGAYT